VTITYLEWYTADISQRFYNEVRVCGLLRHRDVNAVPSIGVFSTETHPFALVYEFMDGLDLKQYLRNEPNARRLELVIVPLCARSVLGIQPLMLFDNS
jgi:serine/threonine protein kinase